MFSKMDFGKGLGFWNTIPMRMRTSIGSTDFARMFTPSGWNTISPP